MSLNLLILYKLYIFQCICNVGCKTDLFTYLFKTDPFNPISREVLLPLAGWTNLHRSLELVVGGCNASSADLRLEEAVTGSTFDARASRGRPHGLTHFPSSAFSRLEEARPRSAFGGGTGVDPSHKLTRTSA